MKKISDFIWPIIGLAAVIGSGYLLYKAWKRFANPPQRLLFLPPNA